MLACGHLQLRRLEIHLRRCPLFVQSAGAPPAMSSFLSYHMIPKLAWCAHFRTHGIPTWCHREWQPQNPNLKCSMRACGSERTSCSHFGDIEVVKGLAVGLRVWIALGSSWNHEPKTTTTRASWDLQRLCPSKEPTSM